MRPYTQITVSGEWSCIGVVEKYKYFTYGDITVQRRRNCQVSPAPRAARAGQGAAPSAVSSPLVAQWTLAWSAASSLLPTARTQTRGGY
jgi:hypothetical protein